MGLLGGINVKFSADLSNLSQGFSKATSLIGSFGAGAGGPMGMAAGAIAGVGMAAIGMAASSVQAAGDFQQSMLKVQAYAGLSKQQADAMSASILQMSAAVGVGPKELADALYPIISSGYSAAQALDILKLSAMTAAASGAQTSTVADALTTSLKSMGAPASDATKYMDIMNQTVAQGKMDFGQYSTVIGKVSLSAKSAGIPFLDMNAALATLTTHGFPSVAQASTSLGNLFTQMGPKIDNMAANAKKMGLSFDESAFSGMSLSDKIAYLNKVTGGNQGEILKLLGGSATALKAFNSLSGATKDYSNNLTALQGSQGATAGVFQTASQGYNFHMQQMNAAFQVLQVTVGNALLPILTQLMQAVTPLITQFANWISGLQSGKTTISGFSGLIQWLGNFAQTVLVPIWTTFQDVLKNQVIPAFMSMWKNIQPLLPTLGTLATFIGTVLSKAIQIFINIWGAVMQVLSGVITYLAGWLSFLTDLFTGKWGKLIGDLQVMWNGLVQIFEGILNAIIAPVRPWIDGMVGMWGKILPGIQKHLNDAKNWITGFFTLLRAGWDIAWHGLVDSAVNIFNGIVGGVKSAFNWVIDQINGLINNINSISGKVGVPPIPDVPHLARGTNNFAGGLALVGENGPEYVMLPKGSQVYPNGTAPNFGGYSSSSSSGSSSGSGDLHIHVEFDGEEIAHMVGNKQSSIMRLKAGRRFV